MLTTYSIRSLGCKVNQYEAQQVRELLQNHGLEPENNERPPDLIVIHTCCVTATASAKSRQSIRRLQKQHPHAIVVVCGCLPSIEAPEDHGIGDNVHLVRNRELLAAELTKLIPQAAHTLYENGASKHQCVTIKTDLTNKSKDEDLPRTPSLPILSKFQDQTRAFLKVQDGCDAHCAYCIIPQARPQLSSKPLEKAITEAQSLVDSGHKEIVVTGVYLGAYGQTTTRRRQWQPSTPPPLCSLLDKLAAIPGLDRIRISSLEPTDVTEELVSIMANHPNIMPHLHLSLQSGSDTVLKRMGRHYTNNDFRRVTQLLKTKLDRPALTTDIIVGFPGETDTEFSDTLTLARDTGFAKIHVFAFSPRQGTAAARMKNQVHNQTIQDRSQELRHLDQELGHLYRHQFLGQTATVLIESEGPPATGLSERYFQVELVSDTKAHKNDLIKAKITGHTQAGLLGIPL